MKKLRINTVTLLKIIYAIILLTVFFYTKSILDTDSFKAEEKTIKKPNEAVKEISVSLLVDKNGKNNEYKTKMYSSNSVEDMLRNLRDSRTLFYESDIYTYGTEIVSVEGSTLDPSSKWIVVMEGSEVKLSDLLTNHAVYTLKRVTRT